MLLAGVAESNTITAGNNGISFTFPNRNYFLDISSGLNDDSTYEFLMAPVSPPGTSVPFSFILGNIIQLRGHNTSTDYLFVEYDEYGDFADFKVLKVIIAERPPSDGFRIDIEFFIIDEKPVFSWGGNNPITISQADLIAGTASLPVINITNYSNFDTPIEWRLNNSVIGTGSTLDLSDIMIDNEEYWLQGIQIFTVDVVLSSNGKPYSASFAVTVIE
jgi:hypothetical protein